MDEKGIPYFTDILCQNKLFHKEGLKHIYIVSIKMCRINEPAKKREIRLNFVDFKKAFDRYILDLYPTCKSHTWHTESIRLIVSTIDGSKVLKSEAMLGETFPLFEQQEAGGAEYDYYYVMKNGECYYGNQDEFMYKL